MSEADNRTQQTVGERIVELRTHYDTFWWSRNKDGAWRVGIGLDNAMLAEGAARSADFGWALFAALTDPAHV